MSPTRVTTLMMLLCVSIFGLVAQTAPGTEAQQSVAQTAPAAAIEGMPEGGQPTYLFPETPERRLARIGSEDPGFNPDNNKIYYRFGKPYRIERFDRRWAVYDDPWCGDPGVIRPFGGMNICKELYQHNDKFVWVWMPQVDAAVETQEAEQRAESETRYTQREIDYLGRFRGEFTPVTPADANVTLAFEEASEGLPKNGSFRNSLAVADMNGDKHADLILPAERGGTGKLPTIYLGDGSGKKWTPWQVTWPFSLDYGGVVAADFNKDSKMDLAFAVHLRGVYVFLGDGKGTFTNASEGLPRDFPTRRVEVADIDRDGALDVVAISEGPTTIQDPKVTAYGKLRVFLNRNKAKSWEALDVVGSLFPVGGDWLSVGNFNGDKYPDFATASIYFNGVDTLWLSDNNKKEWKSAATADGTIIPGLSYFHANTAGKFRSKASFDDAVVSFVRFWPGDVTEKLVPAPAAKAAAGLDFLTFSKDGIKRTPIIRWNNAHGVFGMGAADFNGDARRDVMFSTLEPRETVLLLGNGDGTFQRAKVEGISLKGNALYDLKVADVNGDARPDVIVMYESMSGNNMFAPKDGSVHVYLNRGKVAADTSKTAAK